MTAAKKSLSASRSPLQDRALWLALFETAIVSGTLSFLFLSQGQELFELPFFPLYAVLPVFAVLIVFGALSLVHSERTRLWISIGIILALPLLHLIPFYIREPIYDFSPLGFLLVTVISVPDFLLFGMGSIKLPAYFNGEYAARSIHTASQVVYALLLLAFLSIVPKLSPRVLRITFILFCVSVFISMRGCTVMISNP